MRLLVVSFFVTWREVQHLTFQFIAEIFTVGVLVATFVHGDAMSASAGELVIPASSEFQLSRIWLTVVTMLVSSYPPRVDTHSIGSFLCIRDSSCVRPGVSQHPYLLNTVKPNCGLLDASQDQFGDIPSLVHRGIESVYH